MQRSELLALRHELEALAVDYWYEVDMNCGRHAPAYYTDDAVFQTSVRTHSGKEAITAFYDWRTARGARVSVHVVHNFRIEVETDDRVHCRYIMSLFAADGEPVLMSRPAIMMADTRETVVRQPDGRWLYQLRAVRPLFRDNTPTTG